MFDHPFASLGSTSLSGPQSLSLLSHPFSKVGYWILGVYLMIASLCQIFFVFTLIFFVLSVPDLWFYGGRLTGPPLVPSAGIMLIVLGISIRTCQFVRRRLRRQ